MTMSLQGNRLEHRYIERDDHLKTQKTAIYLQAKERGKNTDEKVRDKNPKSMSYRHFIGVQM